MNYKIIDIIMIHLMIHLMINIMIHIMIHIRLNIMIHLMTYIMTNLMVSIMVNVMIAWKKVHSHSGQLSEQATRGVRKLRHFQCKDPTAYGATGQD